MPIGSSKLGVLGAGLVPGGSVTFNTSGNWPIPPGVKKVSITGRGGTGNPGNAGNPGNPGNPGTGGGGGGGGIGVNPGRRQANPCCTQDLYGQLNIGSNLASSGGTAWKQLCDPTQNANPVMPNSQGFIARSPFPPLPACYFAAGGRGGVVNTAVVNANLNLGCNCPLAPIAPTVTIGGLANGQAGQAGACGTAGSAGTAGNPGNPGNASNALGNTFPGGAGGNAGVAGAAGNAGSGGTGGGGGIRARNNPSPGGAGGNGGGAGGGNNIFTPDYCRNSPGQNICPTNAPGIPIVNPGGGGGGAGITNNGQNGANSYVVPLTCVQNNSCWQGCQRSYRKRGSNYNQMALGGNWSCISAPNFGCNPLGPNSNNSPGCSPCFSGPTIRYAALSGTGPRTSACIATPNITNPGADNNNTTLNQLFAKRRQSVNAVGGPGGNVDSFGGGWSISTASVRRGFVISPEPAAVTGNSPTCRAICPTVRNTILSTSNCRARHTTVGFNPAPLRPGLVRAGAGGGSSGIANGPAAPAGAAGPVRQRMSGGGGGGGGRGNAGNAGGVSPTPSGVAGTPQTFNCVNVTPGATVPITVASPGGTITISWNPQ